MSRRKPEHRSRKGTRQASGKRNDGLEALDADLRASEQKFYALFRHAPIAMYLFDPDGVFVEANAAAEIITNRSRDELVGRSFAELGLLAPSDIPRAHAILEEAAAGRSTGPDEFELSGGNGARTIVEVHARLVVIADQSMILTIAHNVTAARDAEDQLKLLSTVVERSPVSVCIADSQEKIEYANSRFLKLSGGSLEKATGSQWIEYLSSSSILGKHVPEMRSSIAQQRDVWRATTRHTDVDNNVTWQRHTVFPVVGEQDETLHFVYMGEDVTAYVLAEQARKTSESQYAALVNSTTDGVTIIQDGILRFVNPASFRLLGYFPEELVGTPFIQYVAPESREATLQRFRDRIAGKNVPSFYELELARKDGTVIPVEVSASRFAYQGKFAVLALLRDITKRRRAEENLRQSQERYRALVQQSLMGIGVSKGNQVVFANPALLDIFGYESLEEFAEVPLLDHVAPSSRDLVKDRMSRAGEAGTHPFDFEYDILRADGTTRTLHAFSSYLVVAADVYTQTVFEDITERKRAEQELRTSEAQLSNALRMAHAGHWEYDVDADTFTFNDNFYRIFRTSADKVGGYSMSSAEYARRFCHPDDMHLVRDEVQAAITTDDPYYNRELEHRILYADGEVGYVAVRFFVVKDSHGRTVRTYGVNQDITERMQTAQRIRSAMEGTIQAVVETIETRDPYTAGHQKRVTKLAVAIAERLELPSEQVHSVRVAATLHDIGKISTPTEILSKPGKLSTPEIRLIREHPRVAYNILKGIAFPWPIAEIILQHHERLDGSGYPEGLVGDSIRLEARIIAVADVIEAMAEHRPYRPARGLAEALHEIEQNKGTFYDPDVVDACTALLRAGDFTWDD